MTEVLERECSTNTAISETVLISAVKRAIDAHLIEIHKEPAGRHQQICDALMLGSAATMPEIQV